MRTVRGPTVRAIPSGCGRPDGVIDFPEPTFPSNLCFAGPALDVLVVTAAKGGRVLLVDRGLRTPGRAPTPV